MNGLFPNDRVLDMLRQQGGGERWPLLRRINSFHFALLAILLAISYWSVVASDRYVSEARVIVQAIDSGGTQVPGLGAFLAGTGMTSRADQLLLREHLLSVDMLNKLDAKLNLRAHYSDERRDFLSRMWDRDSQQEWFHRHYLDRVSVEFDDYSGSLVIKSQAYDPATAQAIAKLLVEEGERAMNVLAQQLAQEQVAFLERQVFSLAERLQHARGAVIVYQNEKGLVSPSQTVQYVVEAISRLDGKRAELQAQRSAMLGYLSPHAPGVVELDFQIEAIEKQIAKEKARLATPQGKALNSTAEEFQRLEMAAQFAQDMYKTALVALEKGRVEATRTIKKVSVLQSPTLPQHPLQPRRIYNITVFIIAALILAGIIHLLSVIIREHQD